MSVRDRIHQTEEYQSIAGQSTEDGPSVSANGETVGASLGPVLNWEKGDVEFWLQVAQVILLYLILRRLGGGVA